MDLIVRVIGRGGFAKLQKQLRTKGFKDAAIESAETTPICAMMLGGLRVDFMPDDESILGFSNRWYREAMETAVPYQLKEDITINVIHPIYFVATKLEAYKGRGANDPLTSRDIEDILNLVDGRPELLNEIKAGSQTIQRYIAEELAKLMGDTNFEYAVSSQAGRSVDREALLFERLESLAQGPD